jgi:large subunit ribosomal protein L10
MAITKDKKREIITKIENALTGATSAVFVRFNKLNVANTALMRRTLKKEGIGYYVAKKTLIRLALGTRGILGTLPDLPGEVALVWGKDDATAPARGVYEHVKKFKGTLSILGGVFENAFADAEKMTAIATIPSVPVLRGMFVNVINSPIQGLVIALDKIREKKSV